MTEASQSQQQRRLAALGMRARSTVTVRIEGPLEEARLLQALEALVASYAAEMQRSTVRVNLIAPPATATALRAQAFPGENPDELVHPDSLTEAFLALAETSCEMHGECVNCTDES